MTIIEPTRTASLVASIHAPWRATVVECLSRWSALTADMRAQSFLVVEGDLPGVRHTFGSVGIADLAVSLVDQPRGTETCRQDGAQPLAAPRSAAAN